MMHANVEGVGNARVFVFLQGPHGSFFWRLGQAIAAAGYRVLRINLNGGDRSSWPRAAVDYRGTAASWPSFFDAFVALHAATDIVLYGDCRPLHRAAHIVARIRKLRVWVFEEGYIRPDWMTLEFDGVNGYSSLPQDPQWILETARCISPPPLMLPVPSDPQRRTRETMLYYLHSRRQSWRFRGYRSHRPDTPAAEAVGWLKRRLHRRKAKLRSEAEMERVRSGPYFVLPLQLNSDYQVRIHSDFPDMTAASFAAMASFARAAPAEAALVVKQHPLDTGTLDWSSIITEQAAGLGLGDRVIFLEEGDTAQLVGAARGVVTINSTVGTLALGAGVATAVMGRAIYDIDGLTHRGSLDRFWADPVRPDPELWDALVRVLHHHCLIHGGISSDAGIEMLVHGSVQRLLRVDEGLPVKAPTQGNG